MKIKIDEEISNYLEALTYKTNALQDLLAFIIEKGIDKQAFREYYEEYQEDYIELELAKRELEMQLKKEQPNLTHWHLDFTNHEVEIND